MAIIFSDRYSYSSFYGVRPFQSGTNDFGYAARLLGSLRTYSAANSPLTETIMSSAEFPVGTATPVYNASHYNYYVLGTGSRPNSPTTRFSAYASVSLAPPSLPFLRFDGAAGSWTLTQANALNQWNGIWPVSSSTTATAAGQALVVTFATPSFDTTALEQWFDALGVVKSVDFYMPNPPTANDDASIARVETYDSQDATTTVAINDLFETTGSFVNDVPDVTIYTNGRVSARRRITDAFYTGFILTYNWETQTYNSQMTAANGAYFQYLESNN